MDCCTKDIPRVRLGNTLDISIRVRENGEPVDFDVYMNKSIKVRRQNTMSYMPVTNPVFNQDTVSFSLPGKDQARSGIYEAIITYGDTDRTWDGPIVEFVDRSCKQGFPDNLCFDVDIRPVEVDACIQYGKDGQTPHIGDNGNWWIGDVDTGVKARGEDGGPGSDGETPYIGENGNWWAGNIDTGVKARGEDGESVTVDVKENTDTSYVLEFADKSGTIETPNLKGGAGKTAYQSAKDGGFTGSEQEFNASMASIGNINNVLDGIIGG